MMYSIGASGLTPVQKFDVKVGCTYYLGASSSPDLVHILDITPSRITYARTYKGEARAEDRRIVEDLIARGCATITARGKALGANAPAWQIAGQKAYESRIGAAVTSWHFDRHTVLVKPTSGSCDANWRAAEDFGGVGGINDMLEIRCSGQALAELRSDERFVIMSETCDHRAPLTRDEVKAIERSAEEESARRNP
jgi:hypothetical protein